MSDDLHSMTGAYALDALDEFERARFEQHLDECEPCRVEVDGFHSTTALLASIEPVAVPASMRDAVLGEVEMVRQVSPGPSGRPRARRAYPRLTAVAAGLLAVVSIGASTVAFQLDQRVDELEAVAAPVAEIARADDAVIVNASVDGAQLRVLASEQLGGGVVLADGLPVLADDLTYQVWWVRADGAASAGLMPVDGDGDATVRIAGDVGRAVAVALSIEPAGGSDAPTSDPIAVAEL